VLRFGGQVVGDLSDRVGVEVVSTTADKTMKRTEPQIVELEAETLQGMLQRADAKQFNDEDYENAKTVLLAYAYLFDVLTTQHLANRRLQKMLFGASTEKTAAVIGSGTDSEGSASCEKDAPAASPGKADSGTDSSEAPPASGKGHGRNGADAYTGAEQIRVSHDSLQAGDACPECIQGTVYEMARSGVLVRITGQAPVEAKVYRLQKLRCHLCGKVFTAKAPKEAGSQKYDAAAGSMIALLKYGSGLPFNRLEGLQGNLGIPLPASTQ